MQENIDTVHLFRDTMATYPRGVSVATAIDKEKYPFRITVNSFASVSLDPLLILWSIDHNASTYDQFMETEQFVVNILAEEQADVASTFARSRSEEHTSELQSRFDLVCRLLLEKKNVRYIFISFNKYM